jgi:hypothetical protein
LAYADLDGSAFHIEASNGDGSASYSVPLDSFEYDAEANTYKWFSTGPVELVDPETEEVIAVLTSGNAFIAGDPAVNFGFAVQAGGTDTTFFITSALVSFPAINSAQGQAGAAFTITDQTHDGATLSTLNRVGKAYNATYNGTTAFADLVSGFSAGAGHSESSDENEPPSGYSNIADPVTSIESSVYFKLSANDLASGTNSFEVIPEPSTLALLALGALSMLRRNR